MYLVLGIVLAAFCVLVLNWARPRAGRPQPKIMQNETLGALMIVLMMAVGIAGIAIIVVGVQSL